MTSTVNPDFVFKKASELRNPGYNKGPVSSLKDSIKEAGWQQLYNSEFELYKSDLQRDVSHSTLQILSSSCCVLVGSHQRRSNQN
jgi:hypothetical protein